MIYIDLILNLSLLVALSVISGFINQRWKNDTRKSNALQGFLFGSAATIGMLRPFVLDQGLIFDGRSVVLSLCSLFYGPVARFICASMTIITRLFLGGKGMFPGLLVIVSSCIIGLYFYYQRQKRHSMPPSTRNLYVFGLAVHVNMLICMFSLPTAADAFNTISYIAAPVLLLYPLATILTGKILSDQENAAILSEKLHQAQKMESIGRLAGGVAHDFNNMLSVILGNAELAMEKQAYANLPSGLAVKDELREIIKAGKRSADLTRQLLAFARKQDIAPQILDLNQTIESMLKMLRRLIGEDVKLLWQPSENLKPIKIDPSQMDQIMANLLVNAKDAGATAICIKTASVDFSQTSVEAESHNEQSDFICLEISDNGQGIEKSIQQKIFEPFFTTKQLGKGTGVGLATVYGIVNQNNGTIELQSEIGKGTTFRIMLPAISSAAAIEEILENLPCEKTISNETVLVVEDELSILNVSRTVLERLGYNVLSASSAEEAITIAKSHNDCIHLLITDMVMPGMDGMELAKNIRKLFPGIREIFVSGYAPGVTSKEKDYAFLQKPYSMSQLSQKINEIMLQKTVTSGKDK
jgi:signal transduction histidine kinase